MVHLVDSSVLIAFFATADESHIRAVTLLTNLSGIALIPYCVVSETATVLTYKHSRKQAETFLHSIINSPHVRILQDDTLAEVRQFMHMRSKISFTDAALLLLAKEHNATLHTFDKQLARLARKG